MHICICSFWCTVALLWPVLLAVGDPDYAHIGGEVVSDNFHLHNEITRHYKTSKEYIPYGVAGSQPAGIGTNHENSHEVVDHTGTNSNTDLSGTNANTDHTATNTINEQTDTFTFNELTSTNKDAELTATEIDAIAAAPGSEVTSEEGQMLKRAGLGSFIVKKLLRNYPTGERKQQQQPNVLKNSLLMDMIHQVAGTKVAINPLDKAEANNTSDKNLEPKTKDEKADSYYFIKTARPPYEAKDKMNYSASLYINDENRVNSSINSTYHAKEENIDSSALPDKTVTNYQEKEVNLDKTTSTYHTREENIDNASTVKTVPTYQEKEVKLDKTTQKTDNDSPYKTTPTNQATEDKLYKTANQDKQDKAAYALPEKTTSEVFPSDKKVDSNSREIPKYESKDLKYPAVLETHVNKGTVAVEAARENKKVDSAGKNQKVEVAGENKKVDSAGKNQKVEAASANRRDTPVYPAAEERLADEDGRTGRIVNSAGKERNSPTTPYRVTGSRPGSDFSSRLSTSDDRDDSCSLGSCRSGSGVQIVRQRGDASKRKEEDSSLGGELMNWVGGLFGL